MLTQETLPLFLQVHRTQQQITPNTHSLPFLFPGCKTLLEKIRPFSDPNLKCAWVPVGPCVHSTNLLITEFYDNSASGPHTFHLPLRAVCPMHLGLSHFCAFLQVAALAPRSLSTGYFLPSSMVHALWESCPNFGLCASSLLPQHQHCLYLYHIRIHISAITLCHMVEPRWLDTAPALESVIRARKLKFNRVYSDEPDHSQHIFTQEGTKQLLQQMIIPLLNGSNSVRTVTKSLVCARCCTRHWKQNIRNCSCLQGTRVSIRQNHSSHFLSLVQKHRNTLQGSSFPMLEHLDI